MDIVRCFLLTCVGFPLRTSAFGRRASLQDVRCSGVDMFRNTVGKSSKHTRAREESCSSLLPLSVQAVLEGGR